MINGAEMPVVPLSLQLINWFAYTEAPGQYIVYVFALQLSVSMVDHSPFCIPTIF